MRRLIKWICIIVVIVILIIAIGTVVSCFEDCQPMEEETNIVKVL